MFIVVNLDAKNDSVCILDTRDKKPPEFVSLYSVIRCIKKNNLTVKGLPKKSAAGKNAVEIANTGVSFDMLQAQEALAKYYVMNGLSKEEARARIGLS